MQARTIFRVVAALSWAALSAVAIAGDAPARSSPKTANENEIGRGRYLVAISGCHDCHTPGFLATGGKAPQ